MIQTTWLAIGPIRLRKHFFNLPGFSHSCKQDSGVSRVCRLGYGRSIFLSVAVVVGLSRLCVDGANKFVILSRCSV